MADRVSIGAGVLKRRGVLAGAAALAGAALSRLGDAGRAEARHTSGGTANADSNALHVGGVNTSAAGVVTQLDGSTSGAVVYVRNATLGVINSACAVGGIAGANNATGIIGYKDGATGQGVWGDAFNADGVFGSTMSGVGVRGNSVSGVGVYGLSTSSFGLFASSSQTVGIFGLATNAAGVYGNSSNSVGVFGQASQSAGVYGVSPVYGVWGQATTGWGVFGEGTGNGGIGIFGKAGPNGFAGYFNGSIYVTGQIYRNGVPLDAAADGAGSAGAADDVGEARLVNGQATVTLAEVTAPRDYHVTLTPEGDSKGLYVTGKGPKGFTVREQQGGTSTIPFTYRVVAKGTRTPTRTADRIRPPAVAEPKEIAPPVAPVPPKDEETKRGRETVR